MSPDPPFRTDAQAAQPRGQEEVKHARLTRYQEEVLAKYIQNTQLQYAPVNREQLHAVAEMLA